MNMTDGNVPCQTPLPFNRTTTMPTAQTDNNNKDNPAVPNASTEKLSRREDDEVRTMPNRMNTEQPRQTQSTVDMATESNAQKRAHNDITASNYSQGGTP
jgi:hypothetical protein